MSVNCHALHIWINTVTILMVEKLKFSVWVEKNLDIPLDAFDNFNIVLLEMQ